MNLGTHQHSDPGQPDAADDFLRKFLASDVVIWTEGSVPTPLSARGASHRCSMFTLPTEDAYPPLLSTQLAQHHLASQLSPSHLCMVWN